MEPFYTTTAARPDLAALEVNPPEGYIGGNLIPDIPVDQKSGKAFYATLASDGEAQTGRTAGVAPEKTQIANSSLTYATTEAIERGAITPDEVKTMGGIEKADMVGARFAKRSVMKKIEATKAALVLNAAGDADKTFDPAKVLTDVQVALQSVRRYYGKTTLVGSTFTIKAIVQALLGDGVQGKVLSRIVQGTTPAGATEGLHFAAWMNALAMYFGVDQVLPGDDDVWNTGALVGRFAIGKFDPGEDEMSHKWLPIFAKNFVFMPDGENPWYIESIANRDTKNNFYDASIWCDPKVFNAGAKYVFGGV